jgi:hypothetical protein
MSLYWWVALFWNHGGGDGSELEPLYGVDAGIEVY